MDVECAPVLRIWCNQELKITPARPDRLLAPRKWSCSDPDDPCRCPTELNECSSHSRINTGIYYASSMEERDRLMIHLNHWIPLHPVSLTNGNSTMAGGARGIWFKCYKYPNHSDSGLEVISKTVWNLNPVDFFFNSFFSNRQTMKALPISDIRLRRTMVPYPFRP